MKKWYQVALFNLVVLAFLGLVLRYKINFELPILDQKNLLHAHSHFAFYGWIGFLLQLLIVNEFTEDYKNSTSFWNRFFMASTIINYAMIISFALVGYAAVSIALSTVALWLSYAFVYKVYKALPLSDAKKVSSRFGKAALFFLFLSSLGPYALAIIIASKSTHQYWYHNALYFFLHFQYNGFFTFAILAFLVKKLEQSPAFSTRHAKAFFVLLAITCIPSYLFTALWHHRPLYITITIIITAVLQTTALYYLWRLLYKNAKMIYAALPVVCRWLYSIAIASFVLKIILQFFSVHPELAKLSFGFRPVIIGYLHLIFLAFVSIYLLALLADKNVIFLSYRITVYGLITFTIGVIINEILLAVQGAASIYYLYLPGINQLLYANTFILLAGAATLFLASIKNYNSTHYITDNR